MGRAFREVGARDCALFEGYPSRTPLVHGVLRRRAPRADRGSLAVAVLSLVFQGVPALLDALRLASKQ